MKLILVSANGYGAGKSTFASMLAGVRLSLAKAIRSELQSEYPDVDWHSQDPVYKNSHLVSDGLSVRQMLINRGQERCVQDPEYWCKQLVKYLENPGELMMNIVVDDLRKMIELKFFRSWAEKNNVQLEHFHIINPAAFPEPQYDADLLELEAKYLITLDTRPLYTESFGGVTNWRRLKGSNNGY